MRSLPLFLVAAVLGTFSAGCDGGGSRSAPAATAGATVSATATPSTAQLSGRIESEGAPVARAFLIVADLETDLVPADIDPAELFTDAQGRFSLTLPRARYRVTAVAEAGTATSQVDLRSGGAAELELHLRPADEDARLLELVRNGPERPSEGE